MQQTPTNPQASSSSGQQAITAEMLQSAVMNALMATQQQQQQPSSSQPTAVERDACAQLAAMGFADAQMNLHAVRACAGNLELAIDMLVAQRESMMELD